MARSTPRGRTVQLRCAAEVQAAMLERNTAVAPEQRIEFRIGIHQGDIIVESDGDILGDGVNVAARLEGIAEPGGICVSARVQEDAAASTSPSRIWASSSSETSPARSAFFGWRPSPSPRRRGEGELTHSLAIAFPLPMLGERDRVRGHVASAAARRCRCRTSRRSRCWRFRTCLATRRRNILSTAHHEVSLRWQLHNSSS
jgi:hypothetical protein